jgi:hypothetical protein
LGRTEEITIGIREVCDDLEKQDAEAERLSGSV